MTRPGKTPLMYAAESRDAETVRTLIEAGADVDERDRHGQTPLIHASKSRRDNKEVIDALIESGADVNSRDDGSLSLNRECWFSDYPNAEPDYKGSLSAFPYAVYFNADAIPSLIAAGAEYERFLKFMLASPFVDCKSAAKKAENIVEKTIEKLKEKYERTISAIGSTSSSIRKMAERLSSTPPLDGRMFFVDKFAEQFGLPNIKREFFSMDDVCEYMSYAVDEKGGIDEHNAFYVNAARSMAGLFSNADFGGSLADVLEQTKKRAVLLAEKARLEDASRGDGSGENEIIL